MSVVGAWRWAILAAATAAHGGGLYTDFGSFEVHNLSLGASKLVRLDDGRRFSISNASAQTVTVLFRVEIPPPSRTRAWEALPSTNWLSIVPDHLTLAPHAVGETDVTVHAPTHAEFANRRFEAWIRSSTRAGQFGATVISRLRFNLVTPAAAAASNAPAGNPRNP